MRLASSAAGDALVEAGSAKKICLPEVSHEKIVDLVADMNTKGFGLLPGYLQPEELAGLQSFVQRAVADAGEQYVAFSGEGPVAGTLLQALCNSTIFGHGLHQIYEV